jgi:predicted acyltransferase
MSQLSACFSKLDNAHVRSLGPGTSSRVLSIDSLRGFDMFWIIGGERILRKLDEAAGTPLTSFLAAQVEHVDWFGFHFYDIIMPLFLFIVGVAMPFSYRRRLSGNGTAKSLWPHILKRVILLWIFGMAVQGNLLSYDLNQFKFYSNTLQAIAAGYLIASILMLYLKVSWQILATLGLLMVYWLVLALAPVPGIGAGVCTPEGNVALYLDKLLLGRFQDGTTYTWILSSLNFGATTMIGVFTGYLLQSSLSELKKLYCMAGSGLALIALALFWNFWHPIVKHIWTGSFVFFAGGLSILLLALFYLVVDYWKIQTKRKFFILIGANAIVAYMASHLFDWRLIADVFLDGFKASTGEWHGMLRAIGGFSVLYFILWQMYKRRIFIKI